MPRIAGVSIPEDKRIEISLTYIYGIGLSLSQKILSKLKIDSNTKTNKLSTEDINRLREEVEKEYKVEGELRQKKMMNIKRLKDIGCYREFATLKDYPLEDNKLKRIQEQLGGIFVEVLEVERKNQQKKHKFK